MRDQVQEEDGHGQGRRERDAQDRQDDVGQDAGGDGLEQHAGHVAADRARGALQHPFDPFGAFDGQVAQPVLDPASAAAQDERGHDQDGHHGEDRVHDPEADVAQDGGRVAQPPGQLRGLLLQLRRDVVVLVELLQPRVVAHELGDVVGVRRRVAGQVVGAVDDRRQHQGADGDRCEQHPQEHQRDGEPALHVALEQVDRPGQRDRQERGDQQPADRLAHQVDDVQREGDRDDDQDGPEDHPGQGIAWLHGPDCAGTPRTLPGTG